MENITDRGWEMYELAEKIFPICRSITGKRVRATLAVLQEYIGQDGIKFDINEVPSGTQVFDWTIPKEWEIRSAYIEDEQGKKIIDMADITPEQKYRKSDYVERKRRPYQENVAKFV